LGWEPSPVPLILAQRALAAAASLARCAAEMVRPFLPPVVTGAAVAIAVPFLFAQRALAAAASLARCAAEMVRLPRRRPVVMVVVVVPAAEGAAPRPIRLARRLSNSSILRRMLTASSSDLTDIFMRSG